MRLSFWKQKEPPTSSRALITVEAPLDSSARAWLLAVHLNDSRKLERVIKAPLDSALDRARETARSGVEWSDGEQWFCYPGHAVLRVTVRAHENQTD